MQIQDAGLYAHYIAAQKRGAATVAIPWTTEEIAIVQVAVVRYGSNHASTIFDVYSNQLQLGRTKKELRTYVAIHFGQEYHIQDANQAAGTILKYVAIQLI